MKQALDGRGGIDKFAFISNAIILHIKANLSKFELPLLDQ